jgi:hypothetical protein
MQISSNGMNTGRKASGLIETEQEQNNTKNMNSEKKEEDVRPQVRKI